MPINTPNTNPEPLQPLAPRGPGESAKVDIDFSAVRAQAKSAADVGERPLDAVQYADPRLKFNSLSTHLKEAIRRGETTSSLLNDVATAFPQLRSALPGEAKVTGVPVLADSTGTERISVQYSLPGDAPADFRSIDITNAGAFVKVNHPDSKPLTN